MPGPFQRAERTEAGRPFSQNRQQLQAILPDVADRPRRLPKRVCVAFQQRVVAWQRNGCAAHASQPLFHTTTAEFVNCIRSRLRQSCVLAAISSPHCARRALDLLI
jgi:hypothetical protein